MCFYKKGKQQQQNIKSNTNIFARTGNRYQDILHKGGCVTFGTPSELKVSIIVMVFNCFKAMSQTRNEFAGHIFSTNQFYVIFKHAWITTLSESYLQE